MPIAPSPGVRRHAGQFPLLFAQAQGGVFALGRDGAKQQAGDRKHQHQQLEYGEIGRVVTDECGDCGKRQLDGHQRERDASVPFPHRHPDDRQEKQIEQIV